MENVVLYPDHIYEVGKDAPVGFYCFLFDEVYKYNQELSYAKSDEAELRLYPKKCNALCSVRYGSFGCTLVDTQIEYLEIRNGIAFYYGLDKMSVCDMLSSANISDGIYRNAPVEVYKNDVLQIQVLKKESPVKYFTGNTDAVLWNQIWFSVNSELYWIGNMDVLTHLKYSSAILSLRDMVTGQTIEFTGQESHLSKFYTGHDFFACKLPKGLNIYQTEIEWIKPNCITTRLLPTEKRIQEVHAEMFLEMETLLHELCILGLSIDVEKELDLFYSAPDLMYKCANFLRNCMKKKSQYERKRSAKEFELRFVVRASYDKQFYCAARLADVAKHIEYDNGRNLFYVTFNGAKVEEIALMYYNLASMVNCERQDLIGAAAFLEKYDFLFYLQNAVDNFINQLRDKCGGSGKVTDSVLISIVKSIKKYRKNKLDDLYSEMKRQNRIVTKWSSEYKLYMLMRNLIDDAQYQYRCDWLGQQSFDIFLPSQNIAIEYQGGQHFKAISAFGDEDALKERLLRDMRKAQLSQENGVKLLYWDYTQEINRANLRQFLDLHGINYSHVRMDDNSIIPVSQIATAEEKNLRSRKKNDNNLA